MRKLIALTVFMLAAVAAVTVLYFKDLDTPAVAVARALQSIPNDAALVLEFDNEAGFYNIFNGSNPLSDIAGPRNLAGLKALRQKLLMAPSLAGFFAGQAVYISVHGQPGADSLSLLISLTTTVEDEIVIHALESSPGIKAAKIQLTGHEAWQLKFDNQFPPFYLVKRGGRIFSGSFSKELAVRSAFYQPVKGSPTFIPLPDQQHDVALANLYVNYSQLDQLFDQLFISHDNGLLKTLRQLPAIAALTLNYKSDALIFNGFTTLKNKAPISYLSLFTGQQPVQGHLRSIFPSTTAVSACFALSDAGKFFSSLRDFQNSSGLAKERDKLFARINSEGSLELSDQFHSTLDGEFAVVTTRFSEKLGILAVKNGAQLRPLMVKVSNMLNDDSGRFKYDKLPLYLLGDAFAAFIHPYFLILDNNLILANSEAELDSYKDSYVNHKFLNHTTGYNSFEVLLAERSNAAFFLHFNNLLPLLKGELNTGFANNFNANETAQNLYYGLSWQLSASDGNFYTNLALQLRHADSLKNER